MEQTITCDAKMKTLHQEFRQSRPRDVSMGTRNSPPHPRTAMRLPESNGPHELHNIASKLLKKDGKVDTTQLLPFSIPSTKKATKAPPQHRASRCKTPEQRIAKQHKDKKRELNIPILGKKSFSKRHDTQHKTHRNQPSCRKTYFFPSIWC